LTYAKIPRHGPPRYRWNDKKATLDSGFGEFFFDAFGYDFFLSGFEHPDRYADIAGAASTNLDGGVALAQGFL